MECICGNEDVFEGKETIAGFIVKKCFYCEEGKTRDNNHLNRTENNKL